MDEMTREEWRLLGEAIVVWAGRGTQAWPVRTDAPVIERFGALASKALLPKVRGLYHEFFASDARFKTNDLGEMADMASQEFIRKYPELAREAVEAFAWCYAFDNK